MKVYLPRSRDANARATGFIMSSTISYPAGYRGRKKKSRAAASTVNLASVSDDISVVVYLDCKNAECESYASIESHVRFVGHPRLVGLCRRCTGISGLCTV